MIRDALDNAYRTTAYHVDSPGAPFVIRVGEACDALDDLLAAATMRTWAFITACNPRSRILSEAENRLRMQQLEIDVTGLGYRFLQGRGIGSLGDWPAEASLLILGILEAEARALALQFEQNAFIHGVRGGPAQLVWTDRRRGARSDITWPP